MYFCPKCSYVFDISKNSDGKNNDDKPIIKKTADIFKKIENNEDLSNYKTIIKLEDITKNIKYKKLDEDAKNNIEKLFEESIQSGAIFQCNNCNYVENISKTVLLYQYNINNSTVNTKSIEENQLICNNPILPRTHDYICKNPNCKTNTKNTQKEAVFIREKESFKITYICCVCYNNW
jgi:hypothetical protein